MSDWQPEKYLTFADERTRPARDLLAQVPLMEPRRLYDLGCGPGNSTALLVERYPLAHVTGVDNSPAMLEAARKACAGADFVAGDLAEWTPVDAPDLMFSNAAFQWVPDHLDVLARLSGSLSAGGVLAVQMPDNLMEQSHALMRVAAGQGPWSAKLGAAQAARDALPGVPDYYRRLKPLFRHLDIWHTIYNHPLMGVDGIIAWLSTTGLRPFLAPLDPAEREDFLGQYRLLLREAYPEQADGTVLLRFPRLFMVGLR
ncbi:trans-aconitate 2-methyltransferase [Aestuariivirga sp.]|uniref:trans-aconitate 2-methyltransferase n=1 Tax=Aestuariivirga sp. TaxID=2650926 RepID=UPI003BABD329